MIFKACALALVGAFCAFILRELGWHSAGITATLCALIVFSLITDGVLAFTKEIERLYVLAELSDYGKCVLKIVGIGYVSGIGSDICRDVGQAGIATALGVVGRIEILLVVLPYFKEILDLAMRLLG